MQKAQLITIGNNINVQRIIWLRLIVLVGEILAVWLSTSYLDVALPLKPIAIILSAVTIISAVSLIRLKTSRLVTEKEIFFQLMIDVIALTCLLYYSGGSTNPFAPLFLLPLILAAATLPALYTWLMVFLTISCYSLLLFYYVPFSTSHEIHGVGFRWHVVGMWLGFIFSALLIAGFTARMALTVQRQNKKITDLREQHLKHEHILALGTLAAGAAHELGTPLSTMAILLKDITANEPLAESKIKILQNQVQRCKTILGSISAASGEIRAESGGVATLDKYLPNLIQEWQKNRSGITVKSHFNGTNPAPSIVIDQTLEQALLNILNNAADASPDNVEVDGKWSENELTLIVSDRGQGIAPEIEDGVGNKILSTKQDGMGLGLFLTYTTLERLGGDVQIFNREGGGVKCKINLPLTTMKLSND